MFYQNKHQKKAHEEIEFIFRVLLPENGLHVRNEQIRLCHSMMETMQQEGIALCDAGVGVGKTYAYLVTCIMMRKYTEAENCFAVCDDRPMVISTSSRALQRAVIKEYIPFLSRLLLEYGVIQTPLRAVVRKGKEHFVCDHRLEARLEALKDKRKNRLQYAALLSLLKYYDMDEVHGLSGFDRKQVCVPKFCPPECPKRLECRYQKYLTQAKQPEIFIQVCNHNYLLADAIHRVKGYRPLLADYRALVVDEAHQLPEAARQMYGKELTYHDIFEICHFLEQEHQGEHAVRLKEAFSNLSECIKETHELQGNGRCTFFLSREIEHFLCNCIGQINQISEVLNGFSTRWLKNRLEETKEILNYFYEEDDEYILYIRRDKEQRSVLCATSREIPEHLQHTLWERGFPAVLTSGTLKAGNGFERTKQVTGLYGVPKVRMYTAGSPFKYEKNCLLYLPEETESVKRGSQKEVAIIARQINELVCATHGHTLVLFTSYTLMGSVYQLLKDKLPFPLVEVWRNSQDGIARFKTMENAVLFAAGSCWEGVDFPGDMVSSLIIVKLPFAVPDPIREAEREKHRTLQDYIREIIVPDMQKKLRQGFGRAIRTESDTCVVSILDERGVPGGKYHEDVLSALPSCRITGSIEDVTAFIRSRKEIEYYM